MKRTALDYWVLDTLANDLESLEDVMRMLLNPAWGALEELAKSPSVSDVSLTLSRLLHDGAVQLYAPNASGTLDPLPAQSAPIDSLSAYWFGITPRGRVLHETWVDADSA